MSPSIVSPARCSRLRRLGTGAVALLASTTLAVGAPAPAGAQAGSADLSIATSHSPSSPETGDEVTFTVTASNAGPATADDVVAGLSLGYQWRFESASNDACGFGGENMSVICPIGPIAPGSSVSITVVATALISGVYVLPAAVSSETADPDLADRATTDTVLVQRGPTQAQRAVAEVYRQVLGREGSAREVDYWAERWNSGQWDARHRVPLAIIASPESARRRVQAAYGDLLGRSASAADLAYWAGELGRGLTYESFEAAVLGSAEFARRNGPSLELVQHAVYTRVVGRQAASAELEHWADQVAGGRSLRSLTIELQRSNEARNRVLTVRIQQVFGRAPHQFDRWVWFGALNGGSTNDEEWARLFTNGEFLGQFPYDYEYVYSEGF